MGMRIQALAPAALLLLAGCGGGGEEGTDRHGGPDEMDRLTSLPYIGFMRDEDVVEGEERHLYVDRQRSWPGYTLYTVQMLARTELIDGEGEIIRSWRSETGGRWERGVLLPDGDLVVVGADPSGGDSFAIPDDDRYVARFNWEGDLLWKRRLTAHHDVEPMSGGRLSVLTFQRRRVPTIAPDMDTRDDLLSVLDAQGRIVESLSLLDTVSRQPDRFPMRRTVPNRLGGKPWVDLFHLNSIEWMRSEELELRHPIYRRGNVLLCSRHQNRIFVVNPENRNVVWSWGIGELFGPHDAQVLDSGNILVFDNGLGRRWSRVLEVDPIRGEIVWEYRAPDPESFYTVSKGSNQRLPNGNTLIADSDNGRAFEVTPDGEIVWALRCPYRDEEGHRAAIVRCYRFSREFIEGILATRAG